MVVILKLVSKVNIKKNYKKKKWIERKRKSLSCQPPDVIEIKEPWCHRKRRCGLVPRACIALIQRSGQRTLWLDALEESKTGTRKSWFRFDCVCMRFQDQMAAVDHINAFNRTNSGQSAVIEEQSENSHIYAVEANTWAISFEHTYIDSFRGGSVISCKFK